MGALKLQDWTQMDEVARVDVAALDNGGWWCKSELRTMKHAQLKKQKDF